MLWAVATTVLSLLLVRQFEGMKTQIVFITNQELTDKQDLYIVFQTENRMLQYKPLLNAVRHSSDCMGDHFCDPYIINLPIGTK